MTEPDQRDERDPLASARLRWVRDREQLLNVEGQPLSAASVRSLLGISRQAVAKARAEGRLIGLPMGRSRYVYPGWQFRLSGPILGLREVGRALGEDDPWALVTFLVAPNARLDDETPLATLQRGDIDAAVRAAWAYGEHGAA